MARPTKPTDKYRFYTDQEYRNKLCEQIKNTRRGDRVLLMSMTFEPTEPEIAKIVHEIELAASRGVHVLLAVDAHSFLFNHSRTLGPLLARKALPKRLPKYYRYKLDLLEKINTFATGHAAIINIPTKRYALPVAGRSHIKAAIVNDNIFIGGCNLEWGKRIDLMTHWQSKSDADKLFVLLSQIIHGKHTRQVLAGIDRRMAIDASTQILIDSGIRKQSLIFKEALHMIDAAEKWLVITCQFFPNSITAKHLAAAKKRGVKVEVIYSHPRHHGLIGGFGQQISILRERTRVPRSMFEHALPSSHPMLHAKLIACDKGLMIGSHNYVSAGVILGTAEIALKSNDSSLAEESVRTLHRGLQRPH